MQAVERITKRYRLQTSSLHNIEFIVCPILMAVYDITAQDDRDNEKFLAGQRGEQGCLMMPLRQERRKALLEVLPQSLDGLSTQQSETTTSTKSPSWSSLGEASTATPWDSEPLLPKMGCESLARGIDVRAGGNTTLARRSSKSDEAAYSTISAKRESAPLNTWT